MCPSSLARRAKDYPDLTVALLATAGPQGRAGNSPHQNIPPLAAPLLFSHGKAK